MAIKLPKQVPINSRNESLAFGGGNPTSQKMSQSLPWDSTKEDELFFGKYDIQAENWDKLCPYQFLIVDVSNSKPTIVGGGSIGGANTKFIRYSQGYTITFKEDSNNNTGVWKYTFPVNPTSLVISDSYAINNQHTNRGVVEDHSGLRFKQIQLSGSFGIWPQRPSKDGEIKSPSSIQSIFGGTLAAAKTVQGNAMRLFRAAQGKNPNKPTVSDKPAGQMLYTTGYYQAQVLQQFFERYAQSKKDPKNRGWRLVFNIPKQNQAFVVKPEAFQLSQNAQRPMEYNYSISLKAWKRIDLFNTAEDAVSPLKSLDSNFFQSFVTTIAETRRLLSSSINLVKAVRSDFQTPLTALRQAALAIKDFGSLLFTVSDLPSQIISDIKYSVMDSKQLVANAFTRGPDGGSVGTSATGVSAIKASSSTDKALIANNAIMAAFSSNEGIPSSQIASSQNGQVSSDLFNTNPINNIFQNPDENFDFFESVQLDSLNINEDQQSLIDQEIDNVRLLTIDDFREFRQDVLNLAIQIADAFGSGDETYNRTYNLPEPKTRLIEMSLEENEILESLFATIEQFDILTGTKSYDDSKKQNPLQYVGQLANAEGIDFGNYTSKLLVPVPIGLTIEQIALRYLKDPDKWIEIATLNNLRSPYIDESGFYYSLLTNGDGRQFNISNTLNMYIGQVIELSSNTVNKFARKVTNIEKINESNYLITVDGLANLDNLQTIQSARMRAYLPGTINSQMSIYIPSNDVAQDDDRIKEIPRLKDDELTRISKIDFLLTENNDIALDSYGDIRLSNGYNNLVQAIKLKVITQRNTLLRHLDQGIGVRPGVSSADISNSQIANELNTMIVADPRFDGLDRLDIFLEGATLKMSMIVKIKNSTGIIPISFDV